MPVQRSAPQNFSPDKHVDVCVDSDEDRGSTPLASTLLILRHLRFKISEYGTLCRNISREEEVYRLRLVPSARAAIIVPACVVVSKLLTRTPVAPPDRATDF